MLVICGFYKTGTSVFTKKGGYHGSQGQIWGKKEKKTFAKNIVCVRVQRVKKNTLWLFRFKSYFKKTMCIVSKYAYETLRNPKHQKVVKLIINN